MSCSYDLVGRWVAHTKMIMLYYITTASFKISKTYHLKTMVRLSLAEASDMSNQVHPQMVGQVGPVDPLIRASLNL